MNGGFFFFTLWDSTSQKIEINLVTWEGRVYFFKKGEKQSQADQQTTYTHIDPHTVLNAKDKQSPGTFPWVVECASTGRGLINRRFLLVL